MSTLLFERSIPRFAAARVVSSFGSGRGAGVGPLRLVERDAPEVPSVGWVHVDPILSGIYARGGGNQRAIHTKACSVPLLTHVLFVNSHGNAGAGQANAGCQSCERPADDGDVP